MQSLKIEFQENLEKMFFFHPDLALELMACALKKDFGQEKVSLDNSLSDYLSTCNNDLPELFYYFGLEEEGINTALELTRKGNVKKVIVVVEDLSELVSFFSTKLRREVLESNELEFVWGKSQDALLAHLQNVCWNTPYEKNKIVVSKKFLKNKEELVRDFYEVIKVINGSLAMIRGEFFGNRSLEVVNNIIFNSTKIPNSSLVMEMKGCCKGMPAVICGSGPSLDEQLELLKHYENDVVIFAGGTSLLKLCSSGITPNVIAGLDPSSRECGRYFYSPYYEVPFCFKPRFNCKALDMTHNPLMYFGGTTGYKISSWIDQELEMPVSECKGGIFTTNTCISIAGILGCSSIILLGMDLSKPLDNYKEKTLEEEVSNSSCIMKNSLGESVVSHWQWASSLEWFVEYQNYYPHINFINTSQKGLVIPGASIKTFEEAIKSSKRPQRDIQNMIYTALQQSSSFVKPERIYECLSKLKKEVDFTKEVTEKILEETQKHRAFSHENVIEGYFSASCKKELKKMDNSLIYNLFLKVFDKYHNLFNKKEKSTKRDDSKEFDTIIKRYSFIREKLEDFDALSKILDAK
jgi:hypothetical protein